MLNQPNTFSDINEITGWVNERRAVEVFRAVELGMLSSNICIGKLTKYLLAKLAVRWIENWLNSCAQSIVIHSTKSGRWVLVVYHRCGY